VISPSPLLDSYRQIAGEDVIDHLMQLAKHLNGTRVVHINSTRVGGGVAEILAKLVPLKQELGLDTSWEVIEGEGDFFRCTKGFHNALQGTHVPLLDNLKKAYEETNASNAEKLRSSIEKADIVFIHDPQPAMLLKYFPNRNNKWIWRCHIDVSNPYRPVWRYLREFVEGYDASVFSLADFSQTLPHPQYIIAPSIDPLSDKNRELSDGVLEATYNEFGLDPDRPIIVQVSRFDRFKDPLGVIEAYREAKKFMPLQLVLAGGGAPDDPEGELVLQEVMAASAEDSDIHVCNLPPDAHTTINALQRIADVVLQKSIREQIVNHHTGFRVNSPEGAALRIRYLLSHKDKLVEMGTKAKEFVRQNFLLTRHLREYLTLMVAVKYGFEDRIEFE
jgi:trehalose synthase